MSMLRATNSKTFSDVYNDADTFYKESNEYGFTQTISEDSTKKVFYLLTAQYGDTALLGYTNETRWKMKLFSLLYQYGLIWEKRMAIADQLAKLSLDEVQTGYQIINNHALNPQNQPTTEELDYINEQNVSKTKKAKIDALMAMYENQKASYTKDFIDKFKVLFNPILTISDPLYIYGKEEDE